MVKHDDDGTSGEEEQCFEKCVGKQMKYGRFVRRQADRHDHVTELRESGVGEDAFDVVLLRGHQRGHDCGDRSDPGNDDERGLRCLNDKGDADQHVNTGRNHRGGMDQRRNRRRTFHRVR